MKNNQIHKDLNTSFVKLSDLLKSLRQQRFVGKVHFKSGKYEANMYLAPDRQLLVRENVKRSGRILTNKEILRIILLKARKPNGVINVYKQVEKHEPILKRLLPGLHKKFDTVKAEYSLANTQFTSYLPKIHKQKDLSAKVSDEIKNTKHRKKVTLRKVTAFSKLPTTTNQNPKQKEPLQTSDQKPQIAPKPKDRILSDWEILLSLTGELLGTVDKHLANANLNFAWMFEKASLEVVTDETFLNPDSRIFKYENGRIEIREEINSQVFVENILEVLQGVLKKLSANSKFKEIYLTINQEILALIYDRKTLYDKFSITSKLKEIVIN